MPRDSRIGDTSSHGGALITGAAKMIDENRRTSRVTDILLCPVHGPVAVVTGSPKTVIENRRNCRITSVCACGAVIVSGAAKMITD